MTIDFAPALIAQHRKLREILVANGVRLLDPLSQAVAPFQVFARDPAFAIGHTLYIASLRDPWRHAETNGLAELRAQFSGVVNLSSPQASIEGGDAIVQDGMHGIHGCIAQK